MKVKTLLALIFISTLNSITFAQRMANDNNTLRGIVLDAETNLPLAYVSVGVLNKSEGTLTDTLGNFNFHISQENVADTLQISLVGYFSKQIIIKEFIENKENTIRLSIKITELAEVVITNTETNTETIGRQGNGKFMQVSIHNKKSVEETIGSEMGMRYKTSQVNAILKNFNFNVSANNFNYIKYRINIYSVKDNMPDTLICNKQIFMTVDSFKTGWTKVDLASYNIKVTQDFIVTVQWVESRMDKKENPITMIPVAMTVFSKNCYVRIASQDKWKKVGMNLSNYVTLAY